MSRRIAVVALLIAPALAAYSQEVLFRDSDAIRAVLPFDQSRLFFGGADELFCINIDTRKIEKNFSFGSHIHCIAVSNNNPRLIAIAGFSDEVKVLNNDFRHICSLEHAHSPFIDKIEFSPDGRYLYGGVDAGWLYKWDLDSRKIIKAKKIGTSFVKGLFPGANQATLIIVFGDGKIVECESEGLRSIRESQLVPAKKIGGFDMNAGLCAWSDERDVWTMKLGDESSRRRVGSHGGLIPSVKLFRNRGRRLILTGSHDKHLKIWDLETGDQVADFKGEKTIRASVVGGVIVASDFDGLLKVWSHKIQDPAVSKTQK